MSIIECQLKDALELAYGKSLPERNRKEGIVPVYGSGGIGGYHSVPLVEGPGVIVGRKGTVGSVYFEKNDFFPIDTVYLVRPFLDKISLEYSYYLLKNLPLASLNSDAAVPGLNRDRAYSLPIRLPSSDQQSHIVKFLRSYDDLIENNRRRIQLLEESARLLYQEWFVHLRFPGHKQVKITDGVPEGWSKEPLENLLVLQRGFDLPVSKRIEGSVPIYASTGINGFHNVAKVKGPGVVTGRSGSLGTVMYVAKDYWPLNTTLWVKEFKKASPIFATYLLRAMKLEGYNGGAAVPTLNRNDVHKVDVLCPESKLMNEFEVQVENIFKQIDKLKEYNEKLAQARDLLLPKLMSGELTV